MPPSFVLSATTVPAAAGPKGSSQRTKERRAAMRCLREISGKENFKSRREAKALFRRGQGNGRDILECDTRMSAVAWYTEVISIQGCMKFSGTTVMACNCILHGAGSNEGVEMLDVCQGKADMKHQYDNSGKPCRCWFHGSKVAIDRRNCNEHIIRLKFLFCFSYKFPLVCWRIRS